MPENRETTTKIPITANIVLEGGGIRGIGHVGALMIAEELGYHWANIAGSSAGSFIAALLAAGYSAKELYRIMTEEVIYSQFADTLRFDLLHLAQIWNLLKDGGLHPGHYIEDLMRELLKAKGIQRFGDLRVKNQENNPRLRYRLSVIASDISTGQLLRLPQDAHLFGLDPDELDVAWAVRMSSSIPFFYRPIKLMHANGTISCIVDGGLLSNFPIFLFEEEGKVPQWPTIGLRLVEGSPSSHQPAQTTYPTSNVLQIAQALINTMLTAHDRLYMHDHIFVRTIAIPTDGIRATQFDLSKEEVLKLAENGQVAARNFFATWDFEAFKAAYYSRQQLPGRLERLHNEMKYMLNNALPEDV